MLGLGLSYVLSRGPPNREHHYGIALTSGPPVSGSINLKCIILVLRKAFSPFFYCVELEKKNRQENAILQILYIVVFV